MSNVGPVDPIVATLVILVLAIIAFVSNRIPLGIVAIGVSVGLYFTGVLTLTEAFAGFGDPTVIFIAALFVVSESLDATGVTTWAGQKVIARAGTKRRSLLLVIGLLVAAVSALISVNGAVAALLPLVVVVAARAGLPPSQLLMPLAFAASAGSMLLLTGTPVNIIVSDFAQSVGAPAFGYFEFALVGIPLVIGTVLFLTFCSRPLLPVREGSHIPLDLVRHARLLRGQYSVDLDTSTLVGPRTASPRSSSPLAHRSSARGSSPAWRRPRATSWCSRRAAATRSSRATSPSRSATRCSCRVAGKIWPATRTPGCHRGRFAAAAAAVGAARPRREAHPHHRRGDGRASGDGDRAARHRGAARRVRARAQPRLTVSQAYGSISWTTVVLIAGMIPLSTAFTKTGAADLLAGGLLSLIGDSGPYVALAALGVLTLVLSQLISNAATVLILAPIAMSLAAAMGVSVQPFLMGLAVVAAAAFLTPVATPANLMVMDPAGYRFGDYWRLGLPLSLFFLAMGVFYVPLIWPF